jgi:hypothetical protein
MWVMLRSEAETRELFECCVHGRFAIPRCEPLPGKSSCCRFEYAAVESKIYRRVGNVVKEKDTQGNS